MSNNYRPALDPVRLATVFKALANEHRLRLYLTLADCCGPGVVCDAAEDGSLPCVGELGERMAIAPSTLSHHLKELAQAGLIRMERHGRQVACSVRSDTPETLRTLQMLTGKPIIQRSYR
jgi:ArsR family transcriptional regulator